MGPARIALLAVAAIAAIGLAFIVRGMVTPQRPEALAAAPPPQPVVQVLVAKRELPIGTRLTPADLGWQPWPANALNAAFVTDGAAPALPAPRCSPSPAPCAPTAARSTPRSTR